MAAVGLFVCLEVIARSLKARFHDVVESGFFYFHMAITTVRLRQLLQLIAQGQEYKFYSWTEWRHLRLEVLKLDRWECQKCKRRGRYRRASVVHHIKHLRQRPDLALSVWDGEARQLESLCKRCHEEEHPESQRQFSPPCAPVTEERWD